MCAYGLQCHRYDRDAWRTRLSEVGLVANVLLWSLLDPFLLPDEPGRRLRPRFVLCLLRDRPLLDAWAPTRLNLGRSSLLLLARSWSCPFVCKQDIGARSRKRSNEKESQEKLTRPSRKTSAGRCTKGPEQSPTWDNNRASFYEWMPPGTSTPTRD